MNANGKVITGTTEVWYQWALYKFLNLIKLFAESRSSFIESIKSSHSQQDSEMSDGELSWNY